MVGSMIDYGVIEAKWRKYWDEHQTYKVSMDESKPKYYVLDMFPYPSGAGLHVGHPLGYIASDIFSRHKRMSGYNVLHPMGFDAFGLPAEEYALQTGIHPAVSTDKNMKRYREQMGTLGFSFDWSRELYTCDPNYYKWTQWIFVQLFGHYYDNDLQKARPINDLITIFETKGSQNLNISNNANRSVTAEEWNALSPKEKDEFLMFYRLAYKKIGYVNWCEELGTVLANDQIKDGLSERGGYPVVQKAMSQWYLRITAYADRLLAGLLSVDWSNALKAMQRNWIGRSEGAALYFPLVGRKDHLEIFTTRIDTIFGVTYMVLAPEHDLVLELTKDDQRTQVEEYIRYVQSKTEVERMAEKQVTGVFTGSYAINPFNQKEIPIWIGEYVLKDYGTGAIMAVPSDDDRDQAFAKKFGLEIIDVVDKSEFPEATLHDKVGRIINSSFLNGLEVKEAIKVGNQYAEEKGIGKVVSNYKMRDANFGRQRYWGEPFPIIYDREGKVHSVPLAQLPVELPNTEDFRPGKEGQSPLARLEEWVNLDDGGTRETDTMPAVAGSSWYYLRYMDPTNSDQFASQDAINYWESVDLYVGGAEHAVAHLLYARFWHKFLFDKGLVPTDEPFKKLINQGMIQGIIEHVLIKKDSSNHFYSAELIDEEELEEYTKLYVHIDYVNDYSSSEPSYLSKNGVLQYCQWRNFDHATFFGKSGKIHVEKGQDGNLILQSDNDEIKIYTVSEVGKMSKSRYNVINPDEVISKYGTDCFRMYEMFLGPIEQSKPWDIKGIDGVSKFLRKFVDLFHDNEEFYVSDEEPSKEELKILHTVLKKVSEDIHSFSFNTAVSAMMISVNDLRKIGTNKREILEPMVLMIAPFAPFISEELWQKLGNQRSVHLESYPIYDETYLIKDVVTYPICINGKKRSLQEFPSSHSKEDLEAEVRNLQGLDKWLDGKTIRKIIVVPNRMINLVVN